jgi:hypothetical protein
MSTLSRIHPYESAANLTVWTMTIKRLLHRYLEHRNKQRALWRCCVENKIVAPYEGRRWCDTTERELIGDITNGPRSHF